MEIFTDEEDMFETVEDYMYFDNFGASNDGYLDGSGEFYDNEYLWVEQFVPSFGAGVCIDNVGGVTVRNFKIDDEWHTQVVGIDGNGIGYDKDPWDETKLCLY